MTDEATTAENVFEALDLPHHAKAAEIAESVLHGKFYFPALVPAIATALSEADARARGEERREIMNLLGMDENGEGLKSTSSWLASTGGDEATQPVTICHDPYDDLEGALIDLRHQGADKICIATIEKVQEMLANVSKRAAIKAEKEQGE